MNKFDRNPNIAAGKEIMLEAINLQKTYTSGVRPVKVLKDCTAQFEKSETVSVMGISGSGKTTLLYALGGLERPTQGEVLFNGSNLYNVSRKRCTAIRAKHIGFVFQAYYLLPELDVLENVMLPSVNLYGGKAWSKYRDKAVELLERVGLADRIDHRPSELSGGEQQRVAIARALINDPDILMADEPTGNLDSQTGSVVLQYLFELVKELQHTLIMVTHNQSVAERCDRMLHLKNGELIEHKAENSS